MAKYPASVALAEIRENILLAQQWVGLQTEAEFAADGMRQYAVVRCLEIVSEATRRLPDELKQRHSAINWQQVADAGNAYRHSYHTIQPNIIWRTVNKALNELLAAVEIELNT